MKECIYCKEKNEDYEEFCHNCGAPFAGLDKKAVARKPDVMPTFEYVRDESQDEEKEEETFTEEELVRETDTSGRGLMIAGLIISIVCLEIVGFLSLFGLSTMDDPNTAAGVSVLCFVPASVSVMSLIFSIVSLRRANLRKTPAVLGVVFSCISLALTLFFNIACVVEGMF